MIDNKPPRLPPRPELEWRDDGVPRAQDFDDVYYSTSSGLAETQEVFLRGCGLPERWAGREIFTIGELGFGTGLNMSAVADLWARHRPSATARLHLVSIEGRLMRPDDAHHALQTWKSALGRPLQSLLKQWPHRARGVQQVELGAGVNLTLVQDDAEAALAACAFKADAWFLDGFSPAKNDAMWSAKVMQEVARLSASGAVVGTYTVAGFVRRNLSDAGFEVSKQPGFGKKRERLQAELPAKTMIAQADPFLLSTPPERPQSVIVIGAGVAGAAIAKRFHDHGANVTVLDAAAGLEAGASANPLGLVMPRLDAEDSPSARAMQDAYLRALSAYARYPNAAFPIDVRQPSKDNKTEQRYDKILHDPPFERSLLQELDFGAGLLHKQALVAAPVELRRALLSGVEVRWETPVAAVRPGTPAAVALADGQVLEADLIVLAGGMALADLLGDISPPLAGRAGQLEWMRCASPDPSAHAGGRYAIHLNDLLLFGASFTPHESATPPEPEDHLREENIEGLESLSSDLGRRVHDDQLTSRTGVRATTPDRLPFVGRLAEPSAYKRAYGEDLEKGRMLSPPEGDVHLPGLMAVGGLGARGFTWAPLLSDIAAALAFGSPLPTGRASLEALSPARFRLRDLKRGR